MSQLWKLSVTEAARALADGTATSRELVQACLDRIAEVNGQLNAFVYLASEAALARADESDARRVAGASLSPLDGVPFSVKDNLYVADMPATWGSTRWDGFVPQRTDLPIERLETAGAITLGKTNTPELASYSNTDNLVFGTTRNPYDTSLTPGGSSGGATAAVVAGMGPFALGTDAGGSTRSPGSITGLYGLRPTNGRIARAYGFPPLMIDFQAVGILCRTLADLQLVYGVVAGPDPRDPVSLLVPDVVPRDPMRVGYFVRYPGYLIDEEIADRVESTAKTLAAAGVQVEPMEPPFDATWLGRITAVLRNAGVRAALAEAPKDGPLTAPVQQTVDSPFDADAVQYAAAMRELTGFRRDVSMRMAGYDAILLPTTQTPAWEAEKPRATEIGGTPVDASGVGVYTSWVNAVGYPGLNVPVEPLSSGLPIGVQLVARAGGEQALCALAELFGASFPVKEVIGRAAL